MKKTRETSCEIKQESPAFLAPGTGFLEDSFSMDRGGEDVSGGNESNGE